jgi:flagellar motor protein MotB
LVDEAERLQRSKGNSSVVVQNAREAAQTAEDARAIAERRRQEELLSRAQADVSAARQAKAQAEVDAQRAKVEADAARAQAESERLARRNAEADAAAARQREAQARVTAEARRPAAVPGPSQAIRQKSELRMRLLERLNGVLAARDTPRGLVVTLPDATFSGPAMQGRVRERVALLAAIVAANPGLRVEVEGHTDSAPAETLAWKRAESVRGVLIGAGLSGAAVTARGLGATRPLTSNASAAGRIENRRVEIVISGDPIGDLPFWDRAYTISRR